MLLRAIVPGLCMAFASSAFSAADNPPPPPPPQPVSVAHESAEMPLALYRSLRMKLGELATASAAAESRQPAEKDGDSAAKTAAARIAAASALLKLRNEVQQHEAELLHALNARQDLQREMAARALAFSTDKGRVARALLPALKDSVADVRSASAASLGFLGDAAAGESLIQALADRDEHVRLRAAEALGLIRDDRADGPLLRMLAIEPEPAVRAQAALALGRIKSGVDADALGAVLDHEMDPRVRMAVAAALKAVTGSKIALEEIPDQDDFRKRLAAISGEMGSLHDKLRQDRHDDTVQIDGAEIERKLQKMIDELQHMKQSAQLGPGRRSRGKAHPASLAASGDKHGSRPGAVPPGGHGANEADQEGRIHPSEVVGRSRRWASLPQRERDELLQVYRPDVPFRWRKRLEAYFVSVAAEGAKGAGRGEGAKQTAKATHRESAAGADKSTK